MWTQFFCCLLVRVNFLSLQTVQRNDQFVRSTGHANTVNGFWLFFFSSTSLAFSLLKKYWPFCCWTFFTVFFFSLLLQWFHIWRNVLFLTKIVHVWTCWTFICYFLQPNKRPSRSIRKSLNAFLFIIPMQCIVSSPQRKRRKLPSMNCVCSWFFEQFVISIYIKIVLTRIKNSI